LSGAENNRCAITRIANTIATEPRECQYRLKIPHCTGRKFPHPPELMVYRFSRLVENGTGW
jgi:hypothetical protein